MIRRKKFNIEVVVVNTREEIVDELGDKLDKILIMSQCVDKKVYDVHFAEELESKGAIIVPGRVTAPGSIFLIKTERISYFLAIVENGIL